MLKLNFKRGMGEGEWEEVGEWALSVGETA